MSEQLKEAMVGAQQEYRRLIGLVGHWRATNLHAQKQVEEHEKELLVIMKKITNYENQMPKSEGDNNGQSTNSNDNNGNSGNNASQPE